MIYLLFYHYNRNKSQEKEINVEKCKKIRYNEFVIIARWDWISPHNTRKT